MLEIVDLHAEVNGKEILRGINLSVKAGEVHAIMGPNGSGKSTQKVLSHSMAKIYYQCQQKNVLVQDFS